MNKLQCPICGVFTAFSPEAVKIIGINENAQIKTGLVSVNQYRTITQDEPDRISYAISRCQSCDNRFITEKQKNEWVTVYPIPFKPCPEGIPEPIRSELNEARRCFAVGANRAAVTMCATALEAMWHDKKLKNLADLKNKGIISDKLFRKADQVRRWANIAKHELIHDFVTYDDTEQLISYVEKILDDVYLEEIEISGTMQKLKYLASAVNRKDVNQSVRLIDIENKWKEIIDSLKGEGSRGNLDAFLRASCKPVKLHSGILTIGFLL